MSSYGSEKLDFSENESNSWSGIWDSLKIEVFGEITGVASCDALKIEVFCRVAACDVREECRLVTYRFLDWYILDLP